MRPSFRFPNKNLMILVVLVASTLGIAIEVQNRRGRNRNAAQEQELRRQISWYQEQITCCRSAIDGYLAYPLPERNNLRQQSARDVGITNDTLNLSDWKTEADYHKINMDNVTAKADLCARRKLYYQRRLLLPF